jgi:hypothetical protein
MTALFNNLNSRKFKTAVNDRLCKPNRFFFEGR